MQLPIAACCMESLGNQTRLAIFRLLVKSGPEGLAVGKIQAKLDIPGSTLSHHVAHLVNVGLIKQQRTGRTLICVPDYVQMNGVIEFLTLECCQGGCC